MSVRVLRIWYYESNNGYPHMESIAVGVAVEATLPNRIESLLPTSLLLLLVIFNFMANEYFPCENIPRGYLPKHWNKLSFYTIWNTCKDYRLRPSLSLSLLIVRSFLICHSFSPPFLSLSLSSFTSTLLCYFRAPLFYIFDYTFSSIVHFHSTYTSFWSRHGKCRTKDQKKKPRVYWVTSQLQAPESSLKIFFNWNSQHLWKPHHNAECRLCNV